MALTLKTLGSDISFSDYLPSAMPWIAQNNQMRTGNVSSRFEGRFSYGVNSEFWLTARDVNGSRSYLADQLGVELSIAGAAGDARYEITKTIFFYQPDTETMTAGGVLLNQSPGVRSFWGLASYQGGEIKDGILLRSENGEIQFVKISSATGTIVEEVIPRSQWTDRLDGTGPSKLNLDFSLMQMAQIEFSWYGGGTAELSFRYENKTYSAAVFGGSNHRTVPLLGNPHLSVIYGIEALANVGAQSVRHWGLSVGVTGGGEETGRPFSASRDPVTVNGGTWSPVLSIRLKSTFAIDGATPKPNVYGFIKQIIYSIYSSGRDSQVGIARDATLTGAAFTDLVDVAGNPIADSMVEFDTSATAITAGIIAFPRSLPSGLSVTEEIFDDIVISNDSLNSSQPVISIVARPAAGGNATIAPSIAWREVY